MNQAIGFVLPCCLGAAATFAGTPKSSSLPAKCAIRDWLLRGLIGSTLVFFAACGGPPAQLTDDEFQKQQEEREATTKWEDEQEAADSQNRR